MSPIKIAALALLVPISANADARIEKILNSRHLLITAVDRSECGPGQIYAIYPQGEAPDSRDQENPEPIGYAEAYEHVGDRQCMAKVKSHSQTALIRAGDPALPIDLRRGRQNIPGRYDLVREGNKEFASMYKPTVYGGYLFGQTASTLDRGELLVGLAPLMYGIRNNFQADITYARLLERVLEGGLKYKFYSSEDMRLSLYLQNSRFWQIGQDAWAAELHYDSSSNSRSMSHTKLRFSSKVPKELVFSDDSKKKDSSLELSTVNEWMLVGWHRILFGPKFVAGDELDLGFLFSFLYVRQSFNIAINLNVNSVRKFDFGAYKQTVGLDLFYRF